MTGRPHATSHSQTGQETYSKQEDETVRSDTKTNPSWDIWQKKLSPIQTKMVMGKRQQNISRIIST